MGAGNLDATFYEAIDVLVPALAGYADSAARRAATLVAAASGIVAAPQRTTERRLLIYYEPPGETCNVVNYADRVASAHGRAWSAHLRPGATGIPATHRVLSMPTQALTVIGRYLPREGTITLADDPTVRDLLATWLGLTPEAATGGRLTAELATQSNSHHEQRRDIRRYLDGDPDPGTLAYLKAYAERHGHGDLLATPRAER